MIKMYGMKTCPYCSYVEKQVEGNPDFQLVDIGEHVKNLKEFLDLRDHHPCYVREDGSVTLSSAEVGLEPMPDGPACSLDGTGC